MKKFLLFFWNGFFTIKNKIKDFCYRIFDLFFVAFHNPPQVMTCEETMEYILKNGCSVTRYGDAEIKLAYGTDVCYQISTPEIQKRLQQVIGSCSDDFLVCIPNVFDEKGLSILSDGHTSFWKKHLSYFRKYWYRDLNFDCVYGDAFISRHYMNLKDKETGLEEYFSLVKKLWEDKDIIIVEGEKSRLGMGNDLFDNAKNVRRILGPSAQCFSKYDELLEEVKSHGKAPLYILALGPSATIMAYDLCVAGYRAIDMGNIDTEYEWYKMKATHKMPIKDKMVYEAGAGAGVGDVDDPEYLSQIIAKIC
ncbi:MAG: DUF1792 domain-containing protein [Clostridia bacterium]|nr:DUF1792 domain-containing protein [Clostridia bacterium]